MFYVANMKIRFERLIEIFSGMLGMVGVSLTIIGIVFQYRFPWITFEDWWSVPQPAQRQWVLAYYQISPFIIRYRVEGAVFIDLWFYKIHTTLIGLLSLIGGMIGLLGILKRSRKINFVGGMVVLFTLTAFGASLPGLYPSITWGSGAKLTFYGFIAITASALFGYIKDALYKDWLLRKKITESWNALASNEMN